MSIAKMTQHIKIHDASQEQARLAMEKALKKFDEKKALKFGKKYIKAFAKKYVEPVIIEEIKSSFKVSL